MNKQHLMCATSSILLIPALFSPINAAGFYLSLINTFQQVFIFGEGDPRLIAASISTPLVYQLQKFVILLPGAIFSGVIMLKTSLSTPWFRKTMTLTGWLLVLCLPLLTFLGLYFLWLKRQPINDV